MIPDGPRACFQCATTFEFSDGVAVEVRWSADPCRGCELWAGIWEAAKLLADTKAVREPEKPTAVNLGDYSAILAKLRTAAPMALMRDWRMAAAGDTE